VKRFLPVLVLLTAAPSILNSLTLAADEDRPSTAASILTDWQTNFNAGAREVAKHIQTTFYLPDIGRYAHSNTDRHPDFMWGNGVMFSEIVAAARHDSTHYLPVMNRYFAALDGYQAVRLSF